MINGSIKEGENNLKVFSVLLGLFVLACAPSGFEEKDNFSSKGLSGEELEERNNECRLYNSFAAGNMQNRDYFGSIDNYRYMLEIGCNRCRCLGSEGEDAEYIYSYFGRSYIEVGKLDSASYIFKQGLKYLCNFYFICS